MTIGLQDIHFLGHAYNFHFLICNCRLGIEFSDTIIIGVISIMSNRFYSRISIYKLEFWIHLMFIK